MRVFINGFVIKSVITTIYGIIHAFHFYTNSSVLNTNRCAMQRSLNRSCVYVRNVPGEETEVFGGLLLSAAHGRAV